MDFSAALPTFVITLREGVEAALVVGIVLAYLKKAEQSRLNPWVYAGISLGIGASVLIGVLFNGLLVTVAASDQAYAPVVKHLLEATFSTIAIVLLSWMLVWMTQQARSLKAEVEGVIETALNKADGAGWGVFGLVAIAVLREGFETVIFLASQFQQSAAGAIGAVAGLIGATAIGVLLFQVGVKINLRLFFQSMGVLLLLIVSGLVVTALRHLDAALLLLAQLGLPVASACPATGQTCLLGPMVWDLSRVLPDRQFPGVLLKAFLGYTQKLYLVQAIAYIVFLATVGRLYFKSLAGGRPIASSSKPTPEQVS
jgi:high-affinity iron transporter